MEHELMRIMLLAIVLFVAGSLTSSQVAGAAELSGGGGGAVDAAALAAKRRAQLKNDLQNARHVCYYNDQLPVQSIREMQHILGVIQQNVLALPCEHRYLSAIMELDPILKLPRDSLCDESAFERIKDYHFRFIQPFKHLNRAPTQFEPAPSELVKEQLHPEPRKYTVEFDTHDQVLYAPIAIRHFFLKFALQLSHQCKKNLINNLEADSKRILTDEDREMMQLFDRESPIWEALAGGVEKMDFDSVLYLPELDGKMRKANGERMEAMGRETHLRTSASENSALYQMIYACKNRFKPLYDKLVLPIVRLSKLGYDYQGSEGFSDYELDYLRGPRIKNWLVIVHVCEIFKNTHLIKIDPTKETPVRRKTLREQLDLIEDSEHHDDDDDQNKQPKPEEDGQVKSISEEEERALQKTGIDLNDRFKPLEYELTVSNEMADHLTIESLHSLDLELSRKWGAEGNPFGFRGFLRRASNMMLKGLAKLDFERFAHYRRNSLFYAGLLNFLSACSNVASISVTLYGIFGG